MYIKMLNVRNDKSKILWCIILTAVTVAALLIGITMYLLAKQGEIEININNDKADAIFKANSYKYNSEVIVIGNKTTNKYYIEEKYKKEDDKESFDIKTINENGTEINYTIDKNGLKVKSTSQISEYILSDYVVKKTNLLSISTFISLYNDIENYITSNEPNDSVKIEVEEVEDKILYRIVFNDYNIDIFESYREILNDTVRISKMELLLSKDTKKPLEYIVYNKENKGYIDINYSFFDITDKFN